MCMYMYVMFVERERRREGEREMDKCFQNRGGEHWENVKCRGNGFFLRESILTDEDIAKYKTQWGKKAETAKIEAGFNTDWLLDIRALKFKSSSKSIIVKVTENDEFLRKIQKLGVKVPS